MNNIILNDEEEEKSLGLVDCFGECDNCFRQLDESDYGGKCEYCYVKANPHFNIGIGRNCDHCNVELQKYRWVKVYGNNAQECCRICFDKIQEKEIN